MVISLATLARMAEIWGMSRELGLARGCRFGESHEAAIVRVVT